MWCSIFCHGEYFQYCLKRYDFAVKDLGKKRSLLLFVVVDCFGEEWWCLSIDYYLSLAVLCGLVLRLTMSEMVAPLSSSVSAFLMQLKVALNGSPVLIHKNMSVPRRLPEVQKSNLSYPEKRWLFGLGVVVAVQTGISQILCNRVGLFLSFERGKLEPQGSAVLIGQVVVQFGRIGVHSADEVLYPI